MEKWKIFDDELYCWNGEFYVKAALQPKKDYVKLTQSDGTVTYVEEKYLRKPEFVPNEKPVQFPIERPVQIPKARPAPIARLDDLCDLPVPPRVTPRPPEPTFRPWANGGSMDNVGRVYDISAPEMARRQRRFFPYDTPAAERTGY